MPCGTVWVAFLADPEPFMNGARDLGTIAAGTIVQPLADMASRRPHRTRCQS